MAVKLGFLHCLPPLLLLLPAFCNPDDDFTRSRATYYGSPDCLGTPTGACGYEEYGRDLNDGDVGAVSGLYRNGTGCGACYRVRCTHPGLCNKKGVKVVVTDHGDGDHTDFILSPTAFSQMAGPPKMAAALFASGVIDIEYKRVPCLYPGYNLVFKVHENSSFPHYLAIIILYQAGKKDITAIELWEEHRQEWRGMRRAYGGVWDMANPPQGDISLKLHVSDDCEDKWVELTNVIPSNWKAGAAYDSTMQLT